MRKRGWIEGLWVDVRVEMDFEILRFLSGRGSSIGSGGIDCAEGF